MTTTDEVLQRIKRGGVGRWWTPEDFAELDADPLTVDAVMARMVSSDQLQRIRRGLYWRGERGRFGMTPPSDDDIALAVAGKVGVGPGGLSAANDLGLTTQVPGQTIIAVPRRPPRSLPRLRFVSRAGRVGRLIHNLSWTEVALLEVLGDWKQLVEINDVTATKRLVKLIKNGHVRPAALAAAATTEPVGCQYRLRTLLKEAGKEDHAAVIPLPRMRSRITGDASA